jgi:hypothetical protein
MSYSTLLYYKGYCIIVESSLYKIVINRTKTFLTMQDVMNEIDWLISIETLKNPNAKKE